MKALVAWIRTLPLPARWASIAAISAGVAGSIAGLVIGLFTYAPTALFAAVELGFPAVIAGGAVGLAAGVITTGVRRISRHGVS
jgi:uncharacterized membrane-anchored protein